MANKNLIRAVVLAALCVWPGVEMYRLYAAKQDLAARLQVESRVNLRLAMTRQKTQFAQTPAHKQYSRLLTRPGDTFQTPGIAFVF